MNDEQRKTYPLTAAGLDRLAWQSRETDREAHERFAAMDPEEGLAALDAKYHDHLPEGTNCRLCGIEHAAINPEK